jgi:hypothetical protein
VSEDIYGGVDSRCLQVVAHENDVGMACKMRLRRCCQHGLDGVFQFVTFYENTLREIDDERGDERCMKFDGRKCKNIVDR